MILHELVAAVNVTVLCDQRRAQRSEFLRTARRYDGHAPLVSPLREHSHLGNHVPSIEHKMPIGTD